ncbi:MAG TPA: DUF4129 domain-containing protein [Candidatus Acidoferrum sp.]
MHRSLLALLILPAFVGTTPAFGQERSPASQTAIPASSSYDRASFAAELRRITGILKRKPSTNEMAVLRDSLPKRWTVSTPEGSYSISTQTLRNQLTSLSSEKAQAWVNQLAEEVESSGEPVRSSPQARDELLHILERPEFGAVRPPSAWDLFRQQLAVWIERMLLRLFSGIARYPLGGQLLFWLLIVAAVGIVAMLVFRFFASRDRVSALPPSTNLIAVRTWQEWIRAAREAAKQGNFREAVHSAYWAGIARLEDQGVVPNDRTKTPREYLRMVAEPDSGQLAPSPFHREPLTALTKGLERVWYANRGAGPEDFHESLRHLEALGCPLE